MDLLFDVLMEFEEIAWRHDVILFDPLEGSVRRLATSSRHLQLSLSAPSLGSVLP